MQDYRRVNYLVMLFLQLAKHLDRHLTLGSDNANHHACKGSYIVTIMSPAGLGSTNRRSISTVTSRTLVGDTQKYCNTFVSYTQSGFNDVVSLYVSSQLRADPDLKSEGNDVP